jgi:hypothetical protein
MDVPAAAELLFFQLRTSETPRLMKRLSNTQFLFIEARHKDYCNPTEEMMWAGWQLTLSLVGLIEAVLISAEEDKEDEPHWILIDM